jgi:hypothetical protein
LSPLLAVLLLALPAARSIAGGALDPAWPDADVYLATPPEPRVPLERFPHELNRRGFPLRV